MAYEDFTSYVEADPSSVITVTLSKVDWAVLHENVDAWVYKDKGVDHFDGDFEHLSKIFIDGARFINCSVVYWMIANAIGTFQTLWDANEDFISIYETRIEPGSGRIYIYECDGGTLYADFYTYSSGDTTFYLKLKRDETVGTYGTLYCYIYDDAERTNLVDTLSVALHTSKRDYRYIYALDGRGSGSPDQPHTGYTQNLDLQEGPTPKNVSDSGLGADSLADLKVFLSIGESGSGIEALLGLFEKLVPDTGLAVDGVSVIPEAFEKLVSDSGYGIEAILGLYQKLVSDIGSGIESISGPPIPPFYKELFIKRVNYRISSQGIKCDLELGELFLPLEQEILNILRDLKNERELLQANTKQLSV